MKTTCFTMLSILFALLANVSEATWINSAEEITEEFLLETGSSSGYTEHIAHIKQVFKKFYVRTFLEFGCGFSTKYFIDNSENVISVEFVTPGSGPDWLKYCIELYQDYPEWTPIAYFAGPGLDTSWATHKYLGMDSVYRACAYQPVHRLSYALIDPSFLSDLDNFVREQTALYDIDMAFVDCGVCIRGDLVQTLFQHVPIIAAHDVAPKDIRHLDDVYGYGRIVVPPNYIEIYVPIGMGTAFWIKNEAPYLGVIEELKKYVNSKK
ncbi:hypothetical protein [Estrella lausannensis]|nr:hypothetical protein [Estrella lausannensis]